MARSSGKAGLGVVLALWKSPVRPRAGRLGRIFARAKNELNSRSAYHVPLRLIGPEVGVPVRREIGVVFHGDRDFPPAVFRNRRRGAELDGTVGAKSQYRVSIGRRRQVHVPRIDRWTERMTVIPNGVGVETRKKVHTFELFCDGEGRLPARHRRPRLGREGFVHDVRVRQGGAEPRGNGFLTVAKDVRHLLPVADQVWRASRSSRKLSAASGRRTPQRSRVSIARSQLSNDCFRYTFLYSGVPL